MCLKLIGLFILVLCVDSNIIAESYMAGRLIDSHLSGFMCFRLLGA
ncbi:hypothetical protein GYO_2670 [Bacillus spizizenii TU-B-10]|uniref:Uncharacterized protein n=1 Tax=Bacillus spizizenii (strain DSM 15029 / JCM 12233 / NBRC 101239 / NRRL B-23049 / TU-B-10) TaxID=1052585 RepID=G4NX95_BACS4|nr:hypothetical protein GYO_2670 [Bacillus spizizenii TU-B-10]